MATIDVIQPEEGDDERSPSLETNPRKAATKVKDTNYNLDMMRRRLLVLQGQQEYNRYKTLDHQKRINHHQQLHSKMLRDRQILRKSLDKTSDLLEVKERAEQIRNQIKYRLTEARRSLMQSRTDRTHRISDESNTNETRIQQDARQSQEENKSRKYSILEQEQQIRNSIITRLKQKVQKIKLDNTSDAQMMHKITAKQEEEINKLAAFEQELIQKNSQSLMASQVMRRKYNQIFTSSSGTTSRLLPEIRTRTNNSKHSENQSNM